MRERVREQQIHKGTQGMAEPKGKQNHRHVKIVPSPAYAAEFK